MPAWERNANRILCNPYSVYNPCCFLLIYILPLYGLLFDKRYAMGTYWDCGDKGKTKQPSYEDVMGIWYIYIRTVYIYIYNYIYIYTYCIHIYIYIYVCVSVYIYNYIHILYKGDNQQVGVYGGNLLNKWSQSGLTSRLYLVGGWFQPLGKIWVRQLGWRNSQYMESHKIHVPNHQPAINQPMKRLQEWETLTKGSSSSRNWTNQYRDVHLWDPVENIFTVVVVGFGNRNGFSHWTMGRGIHQKTSQSAFKTTGRMPALFYTCTPGKQNGMDEPSSIRNIDQK